MVCCAEAVRKKKITVELNEQLIIKLALQLNVTKIARPGDLRLFEKG